MTYSTPVLKTPKDKWTDGFRDFMDEVDRIRKEGSSKSSEVEVSEELAKDKVEKSESIIKSGRYGLLAIRDNYADMEKMSEILKKNTTLGDVRKFLVGIAGRIIDAWRESANSEMEYWKAKVESSLKQIRSLEDIMEQKDVETYPYTQDDNMLLILSEKPLKESEKALYVLETPEKERWEVLDILYGVMSIEPIEADPSCTEETITAQGNSLAIMARSGAKGGEGHIAQIAMSVGLQFIGGEQMRPSLSLDTRCSIHTRQDAKQKKFLDPEDFGFCVNSFLQGLNPQEFYFHIRASREGLINTAIRTQVTGDFQRRMSKALEDIKVFEDGSVRDARKRIVQDIYGQDGFDPSEMINVHAEGEWVPFYIDPDPIIKSIIAELEFEEKIQAEQTLVKQT